MHQQAQLLQDIDAYTFALFTRVLGWSTSETEGMCAHCEMS